MLDIKRSKHPQELLEENRAFFNAAVAGGRVPDFSGQNLSDMDLTGFNLRNANLSGAYLRGAILSGLDLSEADLHGASLRNARISGCLFPEDLPAAEISLSVEKGTRIRHLKKR